MKFLHSIFCFVGLSLAFALSSCVKTNEMEFNEIERIALESWMKINRPDLLENYQPIGGYYVELLDEGVADSMPVRHDNAWLWFDVTCRDLAGNIVLTRNSELARMQNSYTEHTHYVPFFLFCGNDNTSMPEGTYLALRNKLKIGDSEYAVRYGTKMRLYLPSSIAAGEDGMQGDGGYEGQYDLDSNRPMIVDVEVWGHINNPVAYGIPATYQLLHYVLCKIRQERNRRRNNKWQRCGGNCAAVLYLRAGCRNTRLAYNNGCLGGYDSCYSCLSCYCTSPCKQI